MVRLSFHFWVIYVTAEIDYINLCQNQVATEKQFINALEPGPNNGSEIKLHLLQKEGSIPRCKAYGVMKTLLIK
ncbi:11665_t:CDS:2 [Entrophospora sp. SA101]|nr:11665_t:CDS:2 [Entrophospora sp. SA101]